MRVLRNYQNTLAANLDKSRLHAYGIESFIPDENIANADPPVVFASGGVRLMVSEDDYQLACQLLTNPDDLEAIEALGIADSSPRENESSGEAVETPKHSKLGLGTGMFLLGLIVGAFTMAAIYSHLGTGSQPQAVADTDGDGKIDTWYTYEGNDVIAYSYDSDSDGKVDTWYNYRSRFHKVDINGDGEADVRNQFINTTGGYNGLSDEDLDGVFETTSSFSTPWEGIRETDLDGDKHPDMREHYKHSLLIAKEWLSADGRTTKRARYRLGTKIEEELDSDGKGTFDKRLLYDALGNLTGESPISNPQEMDDSPWPQAPFD